MAHRRRDRQHDIGKALTLVIVTLIIIPGCFSYYILVNALREQNLCHIGPISLEPNSLDNPVRFQQQRASLLNLYGTYTTFDDASYYFVKTPYEISPQLLPDYGYWSISTLALTLLSPKLRQSRQKAWKNLEDTYDIETAPAIQWDQSHQLDLNPVEDQNEHSSNSNRWCLQNHQDAKAYHKQNQQSAAATRKKNLPKQGDARKQAEEKYRQAMLAKGKKQDSSMTTTTTTTPASDPSLLFQICAPPQTSILASGDQAPYFVELPLQAPLAGVWKRYEADDSILNLVVDDDDSLDAKYVAFRRSRRPTNPFQVQVKCHVRDMELNQLAHGSLEPDSKPHLGWEHAEYVLFPIWNVFYLPGTLVVLIVLLLVQLRHRTIPTIPRRTMNNTIILEMEEEWNLVREVQQVWFHDKWRDWGYTTLWVYFLGTCLEPLMGTIPYMGVTIVLLQIVAITGREESKSFLWVCFGQAMILAQLEPSLTIGPIEISSISLGDSENSLQLNVISVLVALMPFLRSKYNPWRIMGASLLAGWGLAKPLSMELLAAPQWTIPTLLMGHLWWNLTKLPDDLKKSDDELASFCDSDDDTMVFDGPIPDDYSVSAVTVAPKKTCCQRILAAIKAIGGYALFVSWAILTVGCIFTMDWTLVVGNMMTLWLYVGSIQFPRHPLWALYHMVAASTVIAVNTMTLVGWILCHVAIATRALNALPPTYVYASMVLQTLAHFITLIHTSHSKEWQTSQDVPGHYFWSQVRVMGEEVRLWYYVFF